MVIKQIIAFRSDLSWLFFFENKLIVLIHFMFMVIVCQKIKILIIIKIFDLE
jgi:hypothetical protein